MRFTYSAAMAAAALLAIAGSAPAQTETAKASTADADEATRVGTCADARSQMEYFCKEGDSQTDMMIGFGTACANAKNNVKEACEGVVQPDAEYKFDKK